MLYITIVMVIGLLAVLLCWQTISPLRRQTVEAFQHVIANLSVGAFALLVVCLVINPAIGIFLQKDFGLLHMLPLPLPLEWIASFLLLDLSFYLWHRANHAIPLLWRFHNVHHIDSDLTLSTAARFHFGEMLLSTLFQIAQILIIGPTFAEYLVYQVIFAVGTAFQHSNIRMPIVIERKLIPYIVTPRMHGIHHSQVPRENGSNFSVILPIWDRIFDTLRLNVKQQAITIGIPAFAHSSNSYVVQLLKVPFAKQPEYWINSEGLTPQRKPEDEIGSITTLAE